MALSLITAPASEPLTVAELRRQVQLNATAGEPAPTAPTVALASPAAPGNVDDGAHRVGITFVTADGETELGPLSGVVTVADKTINGQLAVTNIAIGGSAVTARRVYLVPVAGGGAKLAATLANNTATSTTLNVADSGLGVDAPTVNTTVDPELLRKIAASRHRGELATQRAFITQTWDLLLDAPPNAPWIEIPKAPLQGITHLKYRDSAGVLQTWDASNYVVEAPAGPRARRGRLGLAFGATWPITLGQIGDIQIRFVAGYGAAADVPALLREAMLLDAAMLYAQRETVITGTIVAELPGGSHDIYWSFKSHATQRRAA